MKENKREFKKDRRKNKPIKLEKEIAEKISNEEFEIVEKEKARKMKRLDRDKKKKSEYKKKSVLNNRREYIYKNYYDCE